MSAATIARGIAVHATLPNGEQVRMPTTWRYDSTDPYAVHILFHHDNEQVEWLIGRGLIVSGLCARGRADLGFVGEGDVTIASLNGQLYLSLSSPEGNLLVSVEEAWVRQFIAATWVIVGPSEESRFLDVDTLISQLLGEVRP